MTIIHTTQNQSYGHVTPEAQHVLETYGVNVDTYHTMLKALQQLNINGLSFSDTMKIITEYITYYSIEGVFNNDNPVYAGAMLIGSPTAMTLYLNP